MINKLRVNIQQTDDEIDEQKLLGNVSLYGPYDQLYPEDDASYQFILENIKPKSSLARKLFRQLRWSRETTEAELMENYYDNEDWKISVQDQEKVREALQ